MRAVWTKDVISIIDQEEFGVSVCVQTVVVEEYDLLVIEDIILKKYE